MNKNPEQKAQDSVTLLEKGKELALLILNLVPQGCEQIRALSLLEESLKHANAGMVQHSSAFYEEPPSVAHFNGS